MTVAAPSEIVDAFVTVNNMSLHVSHAGVKTAKLIIFLHGFPESSLSWKPYLQAFSKDYFAVAPDNRGFYLSDKPKATTDYAMRYVVADILALAAHYGAAKFILVGHDWGGIAAWHFAAQHPNRLARLIVLNAPHPTIFQHAIYTHAEQRAASQYVTRFRDATFESQVNVIGLEKFWMMLFGAQLAAGQISADDRTRVLQAWSQPGALTAMLNWYRASDYVVPSIAAPLAEVIEPPLLPMLVSVKTLVIWGMRDDLLLPCLLDGLGEYVANLTIEKLADAGHGLIHEQREKISVIMRKWLEDARI